jgi:ubiquitin carboxyl-terminal hydrolase 14
MLRQFAPQFAERSRQTGQYAQQDAQEAWSQIVQAAKSSMGGNASDGGKFVEGWMTGRFQKKYVSISRNTLLES